MRPSAECGACLAQWIYQRTAGALPEEETLRLHTVVSASLSRALEEGESLGGVSNRGTDAAFAFAAGTRTLYRSAKAASNAAAKALLPEARAYIEKGGTPKGKFERACALAAFANIAPLGVPTGPLVFEELRDLLDRGEPKPIFQGDVYAATQKARRVLYVTDNAGEIGFDGLVIELLKEMGVHVALVVKDPDFFEDATREDADEFGLGATTDEIVSLDGFIVRDKVPRPVAKALAGADLVFVKGTGSFEALFEELGDKPGIFLLKIKCKPISLKLGIPEGNFVVALSHHDPASPPRPGRTRRAARRKHGAATAAVGSAGTRHRGFHLGDVVSRTGPPSKKGRPRRRATSRFLCASPRRCRLRWLRNPGAAPAGAARPLPA